MSRTWQVQVAKARRLERQAKPDIKELLLAPEARTDALTPPRPSHRHRAFPEFDQGREHSILPMDAAAFRVWARLKHRHSDTLIEDAMPAAPAESPPAPTEPA